MPCDHTDDTQVAAVFERLAALGRDVRGAVRYEVTDIDGRRPTPLTLEQV